MCCRASITSDLMFTDVLSELEDIFEVAGFEEDTVPGLIQFIREFPPVDGKTRSIRATVTGRTILFYLLPTIGQHTVEEHQATAYIASVMYQVMAVIGERFGGEVQQTSLVAVCKDENEGFNRHLAHYPEEPMRHERLCIGFQAVLRRGVGLELINGDIQSPQQVAGDEAGSTGVPEAPRREGPESPGQGEDWF